MVINQQHPDWARYCTLGACACWDNRCGQPLTLIVEQYLLCFSEGACSWFIRPIEFSNHKICSTTTPIIPAIALTVDSAPVSVLPILFTLTTL